MKDKKCRWCKNKFTPSNSMQIVCGISCAVDRAKDIREKKNKLFTPESVKKARKQLKQLSDNDRPTALRKAQKACNAYIRKRDENLPCISCGRFHSGKYDAGHYRTVGSSPENRFNELNIHRQCSPCNTQLSGNLIPYRVNLIKKIGLEAVELIENSNKPKKYTLDEIKEIEQEYKLKLKELN